MGESLLNTDLLRLQRMLNALFETGRFALMWTTWTNTDDVFASSDELESSIAQTIHAAFAIGIEPLQTRLYTSVISQLRTIYVTCRGLNIYDVELQGICKRCVDHAIHACGCMDRLIERDCLYERCCAIYEVHHAAATAIQTSWRRVISNPAFEICKRRLRREWTELTRLKNSHA